LLEARDVTARYVMDFGCGTGISIPLLLEVLKAEQVIGLDPSRRSLEIARETVANANVRLLTAEDYVPHRQLDLVFCSGVFHHIPVEDREKSLQYIYEAICPGGFSLYGRIIRAIRLCFIP
jgi:trans-aconitate methyltransferase